MSPLLKSIYETEGGSECLDVLMKYMYAPPSPPPPTPNIHTQSRMEFPSNERVTATRAWPRAEARRDRPPRSRRASAKSEDGLPARTSPPRPQ